MMVKELRRRKKRNGETVAEFDTGKLLVRLTCSFSGGETLDELLYVLACRKLAERLA